MVIDANWNKPQWLGVESIIIDNNLGAVPKYTPVTNVKMQYDDENIYLIFKVQDNFVKCTRTEINSDVYNDACVELFFSPVLAKPDEYFNFEVNSGGIAMLRYNYIPRESFKMVDVADIQKIEIAHSLPAIIAKEIKEPVEWTLEAKIPFSVLAKYADIAYPKSGVSWRANFYKTATTTSNPHYITWAKIINQKIDFHQPKYFGDLKFWNVTSLESEKKELIQVYPNPARDFITVSGLNKSNVVTIFNVFGKQVEIYKNGTERKDISGLKAGIYFVKIADGENSITQKFIKFEHTKL